MFLRQLESIQGFLLGTSILERLTGSLCDAVTGRSDSQSLLERLEYADLFVIPLDDERDWYRYHHLFADLLRKQFAQTHPRPSPASTSKSVTGSRRSDCRKTPSFAAFPKELIRNHPIKRITMSTPTNWRWMKIVQQFHRFLYAIGLGPMIGRIILLLTTTGRKTGRRRVTPLQYEEIEGAFYVAAARGQKADWFRNIQADPQVEVRVKSAHFVAQAEAVVDPVRIADFLEYRLKAHPRMMGMMMKMHHLPPSPSRAQLEALASSLAMVVIQPIC